MLMNEGNVRGAPAGYAIRSRKVGSPRGLWSTADFRRKIRQGCVVAAMGGLLITGGCTTYGLYIDKRDADENLEEGKGDESVETPKLKPLQELSFDERTNARWR